MNSTNTATPVTTRRASSPGAQAAGQSSLSAQSAPPVSGPSGNGASALTDLAPGGGLQTGNTGLLGASGFDVTAGGSGATPSTPATTNALAQAPTTSSPPVSGATNPPNTAVAAASPPNTVPSGVTTGLGNTGTAPAGGGGTPGGSTSGTGATGGTGGGVLNSLGNNNTATSSGVSVTAVNPGTLAAEVGFQPGDRVVSVDNQPVQSPEDLERLLLAGGRSGQNMTVQLVRNGATQTLQLPGQQLKALVAMLQIGVPDGSPGGAALGILLDRQAFPRLVVREVKARSPASLAGLQPGDEIVSVMEQPLESPQQLRRAVALLGVGSNLRLTYRRGDRSFEAAIPLGSYAALFGTSTAPEAAPSRTQGTALGIRVAQDTAGRVVVTAVQNDSPAAMAGIRVGDQILSARGTPVATPQALAALVEQAGIGNNLDLLYRRNGTEYRVTPKVMSYASIFGPSRTLHGEQPSIGIRIREDPGGGPLVSAVAPNGPAAKAGLQPGDVIQSVNGQAIRSPLDVVAAIQRAGIGGSVEIRYSRGNEAREAITPVLEFAVAYGMDQGTERRVARPTDSSSAPSKEASEAGAQGASPASNPPSLPAK